MAYRPNAEITASKGVVSGYAPLNANTQLPATHEGNHSLVSKTFADTPYAAAFGDRVILVNAVGGAVTVTLPTAAGYSGKWYLVKKTDASANAVTIDPAGAETIDGSATLALTVQNQTARLVSDGTNWFLSHNPKAAVLTAAAPTAVTDNSGGTSSATLAAVGTSTAESSTAQTQDALTDNTGGAADTTLAQASAITAAPVDTGAAKLSDTQGLRTTMHNNFADLAAQLAKVRVDVAALNTTVQLAPTKASVDTKLGVIANDLASLATIANADRARVEDLYAKLQAAGVIT